MTFEEWGEEVDRLWGSNNVPLRIADIPPIDAMQGFKTQSPPIFAKAYSQKKFGQAPAISSGQPTQDISGGLLCPRCGQAAAALAKKRSPNYSIFLAIALASVVIGIIACIILPLLFCVAFPAVLVVVAVCFVIAFLSPARSEGRCLKCGFQWEAA